MSDLRITMNIPAGQRKPIPVPSGKKKVFVNNIAMTDGQIEFTIPDVTGGVCYIEIIPYLASQPVVTKDIEFYGNAVCCLNKGVKNSIVDVQITDILPISFL